ncbi:MAG: hypothetical protein HYV95_06490 [Opitutae bacterium]|nr:hypothetical protein [Opitutae bacterium]
MRLHWFPAAARLLRLTALICLIAGLCTAGASGAPVTEPQPVPLRLSVLEPEFKAFWAEAQGKPIEQQLQVWDRLVEARHRDFYEIFVWDKAANPRWQERKRRLLGKMFAKYPALYPAMIANFERFPATIATQVARFRRSFPDAVFTGPIYAAPVASFNGKGGEGGSADGSGELTLAFGIDLISERNDDVDILYAHELFHIYHGKAAGIDEKVFAEQGRLTLPLWMEGFATYVSGLLNPDKPDGELLMDASLGRVAASERRWLAAEFLKVAGGKAVDEHGSLAFNQWFSAGESKVRADLPSRCGYWLGLAVARELAKTHPLDEMVRWRVPEIHRHMLEALQELARSN